MWRPDQQKLLTSLPAYVEAPLTYSEVGASATSMPAGYHQVTRRTIMGHGQGALQAAAAALLGWEMHRRAGLAVAASAPTARAGVTSVMSVSVGPLGVLIPCRVVWVVDEPQRQGFAYGTLAGHPERGEEAFVVERDAQDVVRLTITAFSRPGNLLVRLGGPVPRMIQSVMTRRYEHGLSAAL